MNASEESLCKEKAIENRWKNLQVNIIRNGINSYYTTVEL